jgi:DNA helicase II / ATP-dependent DNA helicase PcrA
MTRPPNLPAVRAAADVQQFLEGLNDSQRAAVCHPGGPLLVLAGAGSGKTRVLTLRISWLVQEAGLRPWEVLALTFTNKAAKEMKERVSRYLGPDGRDCWVSTFHSTCLRILRREIDLIDGFAGDFVIYDDRDSKELVKRLLKENKVPTTVNPRAISTAIDRAKNDALSPEELAAERRPDIDPRVPEIYRQYQDRLQAANAVDFGDLILHTIRLFDAHPSVLARYRNRFNHVLVDEYQDTNHSQYKLLTQLADHGPRNVCVVGDEDQSIYSFRGADIRNILDFERDFPGATVVRLERNYRSTKAILQAATAVVERNEERKGKTLWTDKPGGEPISLHTSFDDREEARTAVQLVRRELHAGRKPKDIALFYRTNGQSRLVEEEFLAARLPFVLIGGQRFYQRREVKDALAWLRFLHNPKDDISLLRIINTPPRGIGAKTVDAVMSRGQLSEGGAWQGVVELVDDDTTPKRQAKPLRAFRDLVDALQVARTGRPLPELVEAVLERSGMADQLRQDGSFEAEGRLSNLQELMNSTADYAAHPPGEGLVEFLDRVALVADVDKLEDAEEAEEGRITLMTVHSSKGLEYPVVLVIGMDEGLFPHARASTFQSELEEERRLAYVAITRAQEKLHLLRARRRPGQGQMRGSYAQTEPSRFLRDIPRELLEGSLDLGRSWAPAQPSARSRGDSYVEYDEQPRTPQSLSGSRFDRPAPAQRRRDLAEPEHEPRVVMEPEEAGGMLRVGTRVLHPQFGQGEIRVLDGPGDNRRATIYFRDGGNKRIYLRYANLEILSI